MRTHKVLLQTSKNTGSYIHIFCKNLVSFILIHFHTSQIKQLVCRYHQIVLRNRPFSKTDRAIPSSLYTMFYTLNVKSAHHPRFTANNRMPGKDSIIRPFLTKINEVIPNSVHLKNGILYQTDFKWCLSSFCRCRSFFLNDVTKWIQSPSNHIQTTENIQNYFETSTHQIVNTTIARTDAIYKQTHSETKQDNNLWKAKRDVYISNKNTITKTTTSKSLENSLFEHKLFLIEV